MHPTLKIQEVLLNIFCHCRPPHASEGTYSLYALARTCQAFKEPALDVLWEELDDLSPLVHCLPAGVQPGLEDSSGRPLTQTEWDALRSYTCRIRSIRNFPCGLDCRSLRALSNPPATEPLFPKLRYLHCEYTFEAIPLLHLPLPSLVSLDLEFEDEPTFRHFKSFSKFSPNLQRLSVHMFQFALLGQTDPNYICGWRNLQSVVCPQFCLDLDILMHLSRIPAFTTLTFLPSATLPDRITTSDSLLLFSNLRNLTLHCPFLHTISRLLSRVRLPAIRSFAALVGECPSRQDLSFFLASVKTCGAGHTIRKLQLSPSSVLSNMWDLVRRREILVSLEDLEPCMDFSNLRCIELSIAWSMGLTDDELVALASAWPRLEHLVINVKWDWNVPVGITPSGLVQLLRACRSLSQIALVLDTRGYTEVLESPASLGLSLPRALSINVLDSIIEPESVPAVSAFFTRIALPSKFSLSAWQTWMTPEPPSMREYVERWGDVDRQVNDALNRSL